MFGKECLGVVVAPIDEHKVIRATRVNLSRDNMGLDIILYAR